jgi:hypothetical protein
VTALGLAAILDSGVVQGEVEPSNAVTTAIVAATPELIAVWSELLAEIKESRPLDTSRYVRPTSPIASMDIGAALFDDDDASEDWLQDVSPGAARAQRTALADSTLTIAVHSHIATVLSHAQSSSPAFATALHTMDPLVVDMFMKDLQCT